MGILNDYINFAKTLTLPKVYNSILLRFSYNISIILNKQQHWGKPEFLSIEPSNFCNLQCPMCPLGFTDKKLDKQFIPIELYKKTINETYRWLTNLQLFFQGEPFLNPKLSELIEYATQKNIYTTVSTNGHFLDKESCTKIIKSGLKRLIISIDGTTQEIYGNYRVGGSLEKVLQGINNIIKTKQELKTTYPTVIMQFVIFRFNEHQINDIKELAKNLQVDKLQLKTAQIEDIEKNASYLPKDTNLSRYKNINNQLTLKRKNRFFCKRIWFGSVITTYGVLLPCCFDKKASHSFGNINNNSVIELFKNNASHIFRKRVWKSHEEVNICRNCTEGIRNVFV